ncbi:MAG TPA: homogentisate 1,2-dioxygenase [Saprospiraceae bacterium]|nr:homogentisate 1,2-dioxygenase [Saprospiraceae bacterium]
MHYYSLGKIPKKRHTQFRDDAGQLYQEELFSTEGFSNIYSLIYHLHPPTKMIQVGRPYSVAPKIIKDHQLNPRRLRGMKIKPEDDYLQSRKPVLVNSDIKIVLAAPRQGTKDYFFKNADADEIIFIHKGSGTLDTVYGHLPFSYGDYVVIPRGTIYQINFDDTDNRLLILESTSAVKTPKRYRGEMGQLLEHSPFCERDIRKPQDLTTTDEQGAFKIHIKRQDMMYPFVYAYHPFDAVGWDGYCYPYIFSIHDFEPITGRIHQPPPVHQTFEGNNYVICSFVPRLYDYHPDAIPAPYHHSNIDTDEVLYYVDGDFMSRNDVENAMLTLHPMGIPHGPHPGAIERSIGKKETNELAVMVDTFKPLDLTEWAFEIADEEYFKSWL